MSGRTLFLGLLVMIGVWLCAPQSQARASAAFDMPCEWIVQIKTTTLRNQFSHRGTRLDDLAKASISYSPSESEKARTRYEDIWFSHEKAIGLNRYGRLGIPKGASIGINASSSDQSTASEAAAMAGAIARLLLETYLNQNIVIEVLVPAQSMTSISSVLQRRFNCSTSGDGASSLVSLFLRAENSDESQTIYFQQ